MTDVSEYFNEFKNYDAYYQGPWRCCREKLCSLIKQFALDKKLKILDLGCGRFSSVPALLSTGQVENYCGVDASVESIKILSDLMTSKPNVKLYNRDIVDFVRATTEPVDAIILFGVVMYLERTAAAELLSRSINLLSSDGIVLLYEPNKRAKQGLDPYSYVLDLDWLNNILRQGGSVAQVQQIYFLNILLLRGIVYAVFNKFHKLKLVFAVVKKIEKWVWRIEFALESLLSWFGWGCDYLIIIQKKKPTCCLKD